ncbi:MAG: carbohydrate-binding family 9-like protein [Kiritimatiellia bacterium]|nr:carbohydrate-binding family 9-like protein [Kiritimatiellia bacterium]
MKKNTFNQIYPCHYTDEKIKIDGHLDEKAWKKAPVLDFLIAMTDKPALSRTEGRILWDKNYLYVGFKAYDKDIWGYLTKRDSCTCHEDVLEVFIKPDLKTQDRYYNFEINALGTVYDAFNVNRHAGGEEMRRWARWNCKGLKVGVQIKGTLNNWEDEDEYWQLEVAIPFASLPTLKGKSPKPGDTWKFHLARYDYSVYLKKGVELSSCARLKHLDFHNVREWRMMRFV